MRAKGQELRRNVKAEEPMMEPIILKPQIYGRLPSLTPIRFREPIVQKNPSEMNIAAWKQPMFQTTYDIQRKKEKQFMSQTKKKAVKYTSSNSP